MKGMSDTAKRFVDVFSPAFEIRTHCCVLLGELLTEDIDQDRIDALGHFPFLLMGQYHCIRLGNDLLELVLDCRLMSCVSRRCRYL
ncbi:hypothetical protein D3C78_641160 [compost metagenome]